MKATQVEVRKAVLVFGERLEMGDATSILLENIGINSTIKELAMAAFTKDCQQYFEKDDNVFDSITTLREYSQEMAKNGEVKFGIKYGEQ